MSERRSSPFSFFLNFYGFDFLKMSVKLAFQFIQILPFQWAFVSSILKELAKSLIVWCPKRFEWDWPFLLGEILRLGFLLENK